MAEADGVREYQKLQVKQFPRSRNRTTENKYWKRFAAPVTTQQIGTVSHVSFSPVDAHDFAVTSSTRVLVYDGRSHKLKKTIARFGDTAYSGQFRADGKLIVAGCEDGSVKVFDVNSRSILREFKLHKRPTHAAAFSLDRFHVASASDDTTFRVWDLSQGHQVHRYAGHEDYVRTVLPVSDVLWATGAYDHSVRLWDTRQRKSVMQLEHGAPVEDITAFPAARALASAGGTAVCVWDIVAGGRVLQRVSNHQKTVTSVRVVSVREQSTSPTSGSSMARLVSGALDGHVKVYDAESFQVTYAYKYPAPVLTAAVAPNLGCMVVGMADRSMVVRRHKLHSNSSLLPAGIDVNQRSARARKRYGPRLTASSFKYFLRGMDSKATEADFVVKARRRMRLKQFDRLLKAFRYSEALDAAVHTGRYDVVASMIDELVARNGLILALQGRSPAALCSIVQHLAKYVTHPNHSQLAMSVTTIILDLYGGSVLSDAHLTLAMQAMLAKVNEEIKVQQELLAVQGTLEALLFAAG